jgi:hypothetical protein
VNTKKILLGLLLYCFTLWAHATDIKPLADYMTQDQPIDLRNASSQFTLSLPMSRRAPITKAILHLRATNSISLLGKRSQLTILVNGRAAAQIALNPQQPDIEADINLPVAALTPGYNKISFVVAQHYAEKCEDPSAPELWVQVDSVNSTLSVDAPLRVWQPHLSDLADIFDPKLPGHKQINIVTAGIDKLNDAQLTWGALAAQGAALRFEYEPMQVTHQFANTQPVVSKGMFPELDQGSLGKSDSILIGTRDEIVKFLSPEIVKNIEGSFLAVYPLDSDPSHFMVVISGQTNAQVTMAAQAFALMNFPFPDTTSTVIDNLSLPAVPDYAAHNTVYPNGHYRFLDLGFNSHTVEGMYAEPMDLNVNVPSALFAKPNDKVKLHLRLAYGASLRKDSVLNILLNGMFENVVPLNNDAGGYLRDYVLTIPLSSFHPGPNRLSFVPHLMPLITGDCQIIQTGNLRLTLFDASRIDMPNAAYYVSLPDLSLMSHTGFPYTVKSGGKNVTVFVPGADSDSAAGAWMLLGKLSQNTRLAMFDVTVTAHPGQRLGELIVMSSLANLPQKVLLGAPIKLGPHTRVPYTLEGGANVDEADLSWVQQLWSFINGLWVLQPESKLGRIAFVSSNASDLGQDAIALQYQTRGGNAYTTTVFTAATGKILADHLANLIQPDKWGALSGDYVVWRDDKNYLYSQQVGKKYLFGKVGLSSRLEYYFNQHPVFWLVALFVLILSLGLVTLRLLMRYKHRHHQNVKETENHDY